MRAVARSQRWKFEVHHFLDAASSQRFALDHHTIKLLHQWTLPPQLGPGRWLSRLIARAKSNVRDSPLALDDDDRAAIGKRCTLAVIRWQRLRHRAEDRSKQKRQEPQMPAYH